MKIRSLFIILTVIFFSVSIIFAQTKSIANAKTSSDKKSGCCAAGSKDAKKCTMKDGKMSENCTAADKAKCEMAKDGKSKMDCTKDMSKCPGMKTSGQKTGTDAPAKDKSSGTAKEAK